MMKAGMHGYLALHATAGLAYAEDSCPQTTKLIYVILKGFMLIADHIVGGTCTMCPDQMRFRVDCISSESLASGLSCLHCSRSMTSLMQQLVASPEQQGQAWLTCSALLGAIAV